TLMTAECPPFKAGKTTNIEFWHYDQQLLLIVDGKRIGDPVGYDWAPDQRLEFVSGRLFDELRYLPGSTPENPRYNFETLLQPSTYEAHGRPSISFSFEGSPVTLHRVGIDRDIYYRPFHNSLRAPQRAFAWHPDDLVNLGPDHFFMLGDNS